MFAIAASSTGRRNTLRLEGKDGAYDETSGVFRGFRIVLFQPGATHPRRKPSR